MTSQHNTINQLPLVIADEETPNLPGLSESLQAKFNIVIVPRLSKDKIRELEEAVRAEVTGIITWGHPIVDAEVISWFPHLRVISNYGVGIDHVRASDMKERGIQVGNTPDVLSVTTADLGMALLLASARRVAEGDVYCRTKGITEYYGHFMLGYDVSFATVGIIGLGQIGRAFAQRAAGFDMTVLYHNRHRLPLSAEAEVKAEYCSLNDLLTRSDFVVLSMPANRDSYKMIGRRELALMKPSAHLINVARGSVLDYDALADALEKKTIAGAGLDVADPEPLPDGHKLLHLANVVLTPHVGSATTSARLASAHRMMQNLQAGVLGQTIPFSPKEL